MYQDFSSSIPDLSIPESPWGMFQHCSKMHLWLFRDCSRTFLWCLQYHSNDVCSRKPRPEENSRTVPRGLWKSRKTVPQLLHTVFVLFHEAYSIPSHIRAYLRGWHIEWDSVCIKKLGCLNLRISPWAILSRGFQPRLRWRENLFFFSLDPYSFSDFLYKRLFHDFFPGLSLKWRSLKRLFYLPCHRDDFPGSFQLHKRPSESKKTGDAETAKLNAGKFPEDRVFIVLFTTVKRRGSEDIGMSIVCNFWGMRDGDGRV